MDDLDNAKSFKPLRIPPRAVDSSSHVTQASAKPEDTPASRMDAMYYEIEYDSVPYPGVGKYVLKPQKITEPELDEIRDRFYRMRDIARKHRSHYDYSRFFDRRVQNENARIFFEQGLFMQDFTDDYADIAQFKQYFPNYQLMGYEQLRTYFSWRTQVRAGDITDIGLSYAFLYIYELLGNIGVTNPADGLDKLLFFWRSYRTLDHTVDAYVLRWIKDYFIYYNMSETWVEFLKHFKLTDSYPDTIELSEEQSDFDLFCSISRYDIRKSSFYGDETSLLISSCFTYVLEQVKQAFEAAGIHFDDAFFYPTRKLTVWRPFKDALFYNHAQQADRRVVFSKNEIYLCRSNEWTTSANITTEKGRQFIGYVMKQMESTLRKIKKFKYRLNANVDMIHADTQRVLARAGLQIEAVVTTAVLEYYRELNKTVVNVNPSQLEKIRQEAMATQEALIVEEPKDPGKMPNLPTSSEPSGNLGLGSSASGLDAKLSASELDAKPPSASGLDAKPSAYEVFADFAEAATVSDTSVWDDLKAALNSIELTALAALLNGQDIKALADANAIMLEVLIDAINEKAMDYLGDNLIDEELALYDDYLDSVKELTT